MHAGNEEAGHRKQADRLITDERQVEVAGPRAICVERGTVLPSLTGDGAAAQHNAGAGRNVLAQHAQELGESFLVVAEREAQDVRALLLVGQFPFVHVLSSAKCLS